LTYSPILSATTGSSPFSVVISFFTSAQGSYKIPIRKERAKQGKFNFVKFVNCRRDTADFIRWDATYFEYTIEDFSMIKLIENGINDTYEKAMNHTFIVNSPTSSLERIVHSKLKSSASEIIGSQAPQISKSYQT
jgi:hypothetical protein